MSAPPSVSLNSVPFKRTVVGSGSCSLLPPQTMFFLSRRLITDCHTVSHNCSFVSLVRPWFPGTEALFWSFPSFESLARARRAGPWSENVFQAQFSSRLSRVKLRPLGATSSCSCPVKKLFSSQTRPWCSAYHWASDLEKWKKPG